MLSREYEKKKNRKIRKTCSDKISNKKIKRIFNKCFFKKRENKCINNVIIYY